MLIHTNIGIYLINCFKFYEYKLNASDFNESVLDYFLRIGIEIPSKEQLEVFYKTIELKKVIAL